ncbi:L-threonylcarbamoyladenylate synthase [Bacillus sp. FJAT-47783]|uniref:L-threonylcarbamoyladenylate synthase n=1 Tax=Bacillus sp. FJAT-47783 TaxID=2922712 RepID=UPI001FAE47E6|nr:L-threonylcarbamoyladenylate synthase [Bacillus sp. FJAT-47783]
MDTKFWVVDNVDNVNSESLPIQEAAQFLKSGEVVAFPTETVYGLGADATSDEAVLKIYEAKGRPSDNPLIVHIADKHQVNDIATSIPEYAYKLMETFWPGPLTFILPKKAGLSTYVTAGLNTVAIRMPSHPVALSLIKASELPIAAPSANLSGKPSPTLAKHVEQDLHGRIAGIVDGGMTGVGVESTVLDCTEKMPVILRPGGISKEEIEEVIGKVEYDKNIVDEAKKPKSPGMKYTHYAPDAPLSIVEGSPQFLQSLIEKYRSQGKKVGVLTTEEHRTSYNADHIIVCGKRSDLSTVAAHLYDALRSFNEQSLDVLLSESFPKVGVGQAIMNRLLKAAGQRVIKESNE